MLYFLSDYTEGCHPKVMAALAETNLESQPGYGEDRWCRAAADALRSFPRPLAGAARASPARRTAPCTTGQ